MCRSSCTCTCVIVVNSTCMLACHMHMYRANFLYCRINSEYSYILIYIWCRGLGIETHSKKCHLIINFMLYNIFCTDKTGRHSRHAALNDIVKRALTSAHSVQVGADLANEVRWQAARWYHSIQLLGSQGIYLFGMPPALTPLRPPIGHVPPCRWRRYSRGRGQRTGIRWINTGVSQQATSSL